MDCANKLEKALRWSQKEISSQYKIRQLPKMKNDITNPRESLNNYVETQHIKVYLRQKIRLLFSLIDTKVQR